MSHYTALLEIISASDINQSVWDFRIDPQLRDNVGALGPILKQVGVHQSFDGVSEYLDAAVSVS